MKFHSIRDLKYYEHDNPKQNQELKVRKRG
jgi:hypothetical protein